MPSKEQEPSFDKKVRRVADDPQELAHLIEETFLLEHIRSGEIATNRRDKVRDVLVELAHDCLTKSEQVYDVLAKATVAMVERPIHVNETLVNDDDFDFALDNILSLADEDRDNELRAILTRHFQSKSYYEPLPATERRAVLEVAANAVISAARASGTGHVWGARAIVADAVRRELKGYYSQQMNVNFVEVEQTMNPSTPGR